MDLPWPQPWLLRCWKPAETAYEADTRRAPLGYRLACVARPWIPTWFDWLDEEREMTRSALDYEHELRKRWP